MGIWRFTGSTQLQNLAVRSITIFHSTSSGNKLVGILNRMPLGIEFLSKFMGLLMVQSKLFKLNRSANPFCPLPGCHQLGSTLHMLSGCQDHIISSMKTGRHNVAGRMIVKALSKSPWGPGSIDTDIGSDDLLECHARSASHTHHQPGSTYQYPPRS
eukprot:1143283-Pelagomonas_calceolata.AAC.2